MEEYYYPEEEFFLSPFNNFFERFIDSNESIADNTVEIMIRADINAKPLYDLTNENFRISEDYNIYAMILSYAYLSLSDLFEGNEIKYRELGEILKKYLSYLYEYSFEFILNKIDKLLGQFTVSYDLLDDILLGGRIDIFTSLVKFGVDISDTKKYDVLKKNVELNTSEDMLLFTRTLFEYGYPLSIRRNEYKNKILSQLPFLDDIKGSEIMALAKILKDIGVTLTANEMRTLEETYKRNGKDMGIFMTFEDILTGKKR